MSPQTTTVADTQPITGDRILVVDDEEQIRLFVQRVLELEGYSVVSAADGGEAERVALASQPVLVILDMMLPDSNGETVAVRLRETLGPDLPILVITADGHAEAKAQRVGAYAFLRKPFDLDDLLKAVEGQMRSG